MVIWNPLALCCSFLLRNGFHQKVGMQCSCVLSMAILAHRVLRLTLIPHVIPLWGPTPLGFRLWG